MMRIHPCLLLAVALPLLVGLQANDAGKLDQAGVKSMLSGLGYEVKDGGTVCDFSVSAAGLEIPVRAALSTDKSRLWFSTFLMDDKKVGALTKADLLQLLETNSAIGPCIFMVDSGSLRMKLPIDNRGLTPAVLKRDIELLASQIGTTKADWQK